MAQILGLALRRRFADVCVPTGLRVGLASRALCVAGQRYVAEVGSSVRSGLAVLVRNVFVRPLAGKSLNSKSQAEAKRTVLRHNKI